MEEVDVSLSNAASQRPCRQSSIIQLLWCFSVPYMNWRFEMQSSYSVFLNICIRIFAVIHAMHFQWPIINKVNSPTCNCCNHMITSFYNTRHKLALCHLNIFFLFSVSHFLLSSHRERARWMEADAEATERMCSHVNGCEHWFRVVDNT